MDLSLDVVLEALRLGMSSGVISLPVAILVLVALAAAIVIGKRSAPALARARAAAAKAEEPAPPAEWDRNVAANSEPEKSAEGGG